MKLKKMIKYLWTTAIRDNDKQTMLSIIVLKQNKKK